MNNKGISRKSGFVDRYHCNCKRLNGAENNHKICDKCKTECIYHDIEFIEDYDDSSLIDNMMISMDITPTKIKKYVDSGMTYVEAYKKAYEERNRP